MSDAELLQAYVRANSQPAFAELVARHVNLVYSAALRQVPAPHLAQEVTQLVFLDLARHASRLAPSQPLAPWLYVVTRRTAIDIVRREARRVARERTAAELAAMQTPSPSWSRIASSVDEAMEALNDAERSAVVLRFFENRSFQEVGAALGISEDTAQKRVSRALDRLRAFFLRRGVAVSAATLATDLSAHAMHVAPGGLAAAIASIAQATPHLTVATHLAMTTTQKLVVAASLVLVVGGSLYEASAFATRREELAALDARAIALQRDVARLRRENTAAQSPAGPGRALPSAANTMPAAAGGDAALEAEMQAWMERAVQLDLLLNERPELTIPEIRQFLSAEDMFDIALHAKFDSEKEIRETLANLRQRGRNALGNKLPVALRAYLGAHDNTLPASTAELAPYFEPAIDPAILARYEFRFSGRLDAVPARLHSTGLLDEKGPVDPTNDSQLGVGTQGFSLGPVDPLAPSTRAALRGFQAARGGATPKTAAELLPFFDQPLSPTDQETFSRRAGRYLGTPPAK